MLMFYGNENYYYDRNVGVTNEHHLINDLQCPLRGNVLNSHNITNANNKHNSNNNCSNNNNHVNNNYLLKLHTYCMYVIVCNTKCVCMHWCCA